MKGFKRLIVIIILLLLFLSVAAYGYVQYRANRYKVLDRSSFNEFNTELETVVNEGGFEDQNALCKFITDWADSNKLKYVQDSHGNIIFDSPAINRKKNVSPTVVCMSLNYKTIAGKTALLSSAASVAATDLESGRKTVILFNDENNEGTGFKSISKKYIPSKSKVIYLDQGRKTYISSSSFAEEISEIKIPASMETASLDSAVKVHISGIETGELSSSADNQPDPISGLGTLLTRLKSKSVTYRIADFSVGSNGNMYPTSMDVTIMLNSYSLGSFTKYLDQRIKDWDKKYSKKHPNLEYSYEVIDNKNNLPKKCYNANTTDKLASLLYTVNVGAYKYSESDPVPEGKDIGDVNGINCLLDLTQAKDAIVLRIASQGYNDMYLNRISIDNRAIAELISCRISEVEYHEAFVNDRDALLRTFVQTYSDVNGSKESTELKIIDDNFFTPCSYLMTANSNLDVVHLQITAKSAQNLTNTLMCYIKAKGNTFSL